MSGDRFRISPSRALCHGQGGAPDLGQSNAGFGFQDFPERRKPIFTPGCDRELQNSAEKREMGAPFIGLYDVFATSQPAVVEQRERVADRRPDFSQRGDRRRGGGVLADAESV